MLSTSPKSAIPAAVLLLGLGFYQHAKNDHIINQVTRTDADVAGGLSASEIPDALEGNYTWLQTSKGTTEDGTVVRAQIELDPSNTTLEYLISTEKAPNSEGDTPQQTSIGCALDCGNLALKCAGLTGSQEDRIAYFFDSKGDFSPRVKLCFALQGVL